MRAVLEALKGLGWVLGLIIMVPITLGLLGIMASIGAMAIPAAIGLFVVVMIGMAIYEHFNRR